LHTFRRAPAYQIKVTIIPAKAAIPEHATTVTAWEKQGLEEFGAGTFAMIMREVG